MCCHPRIAISGLGGGTGKTTVALALCRIWRDCGLNVVPFKKGPDYIDAAWLQFAAGNACHHLDPYLMSEDVIRRSFLHRSHGADISLLEGNRGLFDGVDSRGSYSTAALARSLGIPVLLLVGCRKVTATTAAVVQGCAAFLDGLNIAGVVLNELGSKRQETVIRRAIEDHTGIPVVGAIPRLGDLDFPERHLGLLPVQEQVRREDILGLLTKRLSGYLDVSSILEIARAAPDFQAPDTSHDHLYPTIQPPEEPVRIGLLRDSSFHFYYPENLEALLHSGARLIDLDATRSSSLPQIHGLYIGGGFPESNVALLAANHSLLDDIKRSSLAGLPIYAECGGLIYLCRSFAVSGRRYSMAGVFPLDLELTNSPQGHGYTRYVALSDNPWFQKGTTILSHEFHYTRPTAPLSGELHAVFRVLRGNGIDGSVDGLTMLNTIATFGHIHSLSTPSWAGTFVALSARYRGKSRASHGSDLPGP